MENKNKIQGFSLTDLFKKFPIKIGDIIYELKYNLGSIAYLEEKGIPINPEPLKKFFNEKPILILSNVLYAGLPNKVRKEMTYEDFLESVQEQEMNDLHKYMTRALEAIGFSITEIGIESKNISEKKGEEAEKKN